MLLKSLITSSVVLLTNNLSALAVPTSAILDLAGSCPSLEEIYNFAKQNPDNEIAEQDPIDPFSVALFSTQNNKTFLTIFVYNKDKSLNFVSTFGADYKDDDKSTYMPELFYLAKTFTNTQEPILSQKEPGALIYNYLWEVPAESCFNIIQIHKDMEENFTFLSFF